jgi:RimJ/RimL family protein N-acetyltransferase
MDFELQPTLVGALVELRPLAATDFDALFAAASDPLIWEQHPEPDRYTREVFQRYFDGAMESGGAFVIIDRSTARIIGSSRYCDLKPAERQVEIGWTFLEREFWGGRYNSEIKSLMLDHAFRFVERVVFVVGENNRRSQKALEKIGARFIDRSESQTSDGRVRRNVIYEIRKRLSS